DKHRLGGKEVGASRSGQLVKARFAQLGLQGLAQGRFVQAQAKTFAVEGGECLGVIAQGIGDAFGHRRVSVVLSGSAGCWRSRLACCSRGPATGPWLAPLGEPRSTQRKRPLISSALDTLPSMTISPSTARAGVRIIPASMMALVSVIFSTS